MLNIILVFYNLFFELYVFKIRSNYNLVIINNLFGVKVNCFIFYCIEFFYNEKLVI